MPMNSPLSLLLLFLALGILLQRVNAARSISARKVRARSSSSGERYDRSITIFSPEGRLLQLEYALIAAEERGRGLTVCVECDGVVIFAFPSGDNEDDVDDDENFDQSVDSDVTANTNHSNAQSSAVLTATINTEHDPAHNTKIHRLSPTHLLLTSGLAGDSRVLASAFRRVASSWTHIQYGEVVSARELSKEMGKVVHGIGLRPGARVLGVIGMLIGLDDTDDCNKLTKNNSFGVEVRIYRCLPGGTLDRCNVCCTGGGADATGNAARKYATETLARVVSQNKYKGDKESESKEEVAASNEKKLEQVIEEVGKIALMYHHDSLIKYGNINGAVLDNTTPKKRVTVDIWLVKAAATDSLVASINRHRYLGKAIMKTRYARSVALDQLSKAIKCLMDNSTNKILT